MPSPPPPFASATYWDHRFTTNPTAFDWLSPASAFNAPLNAALDDCPTPAPRILHVGCGTSLLSFHLRHFVRDPHQVHNLDFSARAIALGRAREREIFDKQEGAGTESGREEAREEEGIGKQDPVTDVEAAPERDHHSPDDAARHMRWSTADLLSLPSLLTSCAPGSYDVIVDKSTSDAVACGEDVPLTRAYPLWPASNDDGMNHARDADDNAIIATAPPVPLLALHLAHLARPDGARWLALTYSEDRFDFLRPPRGPEEAEAAAWPDGLPNPRRFWRVEGKVPVPVRDGASGGGTGATAMPPVHRPEVVHWLFVLRRTGEEVRAREEQN